MCHLDLEVPGGVVTEVFPLNGVALEVALQAFPIAEEAQGLTKVHLGAILGIATQGALAEVGVLVQLQDRFQGLLVLGLHLLDHEMLGTSNAWLR